MTEIRIDSNVQGHRIQSPLQPHKAPGWGLSSPPRSGETARVAVSNHGLKREKKNELLKKINFGPKNMVPEGFVSSQGETFLSIHFDSLPVLRSIHLLSSPRNTHTPK